jgi:hypothetical protein
MRRRTMSMSASLEALRAASPRASADFPQWVEAAGNAVQRAILTAAVTASRPRRRRRLLRVSAAGASLATVAVAAVLLTVGSFGGGQGVENAAAAVGKAARTTASSAELSGTAVVRITQGGQPWAGTTIEWHGDDLVVARGDERELRVVDGTLYGVDPERPGGWLELGDPKSIDPDSGTTPDEYLAFVREDVGGTTLRRITAAMTGLTTDSQADGSTVYRGTVAAGAIARETGFKQGQMLRVLPFGYVAHDEAADPGAPLDVALTVDAGGVVNAIVVRWGSWAYKVTYDHLGSTPAPAAPANARSLLDLRVAGK